MIRSARNLHAAVGPEHHGDGFVQHERGDNFAVPPLTTDASADGCLRPEGVRHLSAGCVSNRVGHVGVFEERLQRRSRTDVQRIRLAQLYTVEAECLQIDDRDRLVVVATVYFCAATDRHGT